MATFTYKAATKRGLIIKNRVEASTKQQLIRSLKQNDLIPINIVKIPYGGSKKKMKQKKNISNIEEMMKNLNTTKINTTDEPSTARRIKMYFDKQKKITPRDLVVFTQNFYLLKKANFNNIHALRTIIDSTENYIFREILEDILAGVEAGDNMYTTMEYYSDVFPYIYINMIKVGELSGSLTQSLEQAVTYLDETNALNKKIRSILMPNIIQFSMLLVMLFVGTLVAIPAIQNVYKELGSTDTLPAVTIWFQGFLNNLVTYWYIPVAIIAILVGAVIFYINTPKGKYNFHYFKYRAPIFGELIFALDFSRLMRAMLLNLENGMRIQESLEVSKNVVKNYVMLSMIETAINNILIGASWVEPFEKSGLAKPMETEMLKIGMQTDLSEMMKKLVEYMQIDIDNIMTKIMKALPQAVYLIVGVVLIFFVLVVLVPCVQVYMGNFLFSAYL